MQINPKPGIDIQTIGNEKTLYPYERSEVFDALMQGAILEKLPGVKPLYGEDISSLGTFYIDGQQFDVTPDILDEALLFLDRPYTDGIPQRCMTTPDVTDSWLRLLVQLLNAGYWHLVDNKND